MPTPPPENPDPSGSRRVRRILLRIVVPAVAGIALLVYLVVDFRGRRSLAPRPPPGGALHAVPELPPSRVGLHVRYDLDQAFRAAEDRISTRFGSLEDRRIRPEFRVEELMPASNALRDRCQVSVGPLQLDATDPLLATARAQLQQELANLDAALGQLDLEAAIKSRWAQLRNPIRLGDSAWLQLDADSIVVEGLELRAPNGRILSARVALVGQPTVVVGSRPSPLDGRPPLVPGSVEEDFVALLETRIEHEAAAQMATDVLRDRTFEIAGRTLRFEDVDVLGADGGRVALEVEVDGALAGRLYLVGTPELDPSTGLITVPDLGFSVQTRNLLVRGAAWLLRGTFVEQVRGYARWDVGPSIETVRSLASMELDRRVSETILVQGSLGIVTLTTVGYGDVFPVSPAGRVLGGFFALTAVLLIALPTAILWAPPSSRGWSRGAPAGARGGILNPDPRRLQMRGRPGTPTVER